MITSPKERQHTRWLLVLLSLVAIPSLFYIYEKLNGTQIPWLMLVREVIPNLIATLLGIVLIYFLFTRKGIPVNGHLTAEDLDEMLKKHLEPTYRFPEITGFYASFRDVSWKDVLPKTQTSIEIVVNYWDSWMAHHREALSEFFRKPNAKMRIFVPDPRNLRLMGELNKLYPGNGIEGLRQKIMRTGDNARKALVEAGGTPDQLEFYYVPRCLTYAVQVLDRRFLILSNYDMFRMDRVGAPAFELDLDKSKSVGEYWRAEMYGFKKHSESVNPDFEAQQTQMKR